MDNLELRGCSSVGRALAWHARGQGFKSPQLHKMNLVFAKIILNEIKELASTQIFIVVILFIQVGIVTRQLGVEAFGRVSLLIVIVSFVFNIFK